MGKNFLVYHIGRFHWPRLVMWRSPVVVEQMLFVRISGILIEGCSTAAHLLDDPFAQTAVSNSFTCLKFLIKPLRRSQTHWRNLVAKLVFLSFLTCWPERGVFQPVASLKLPIFVTFPHSILPNTPLCYGAALERPKLQLPAVDLHSHLFPF